MNMFVISILTMVVQNIINLSPRKEDISVKCGQLGSQPDSGHSMYRITMSKAKNLQLRSVEGYINMGTVNRCGSN